MAKRPAPAAEAPPSKRSVPVANCTLYVSNLNDKINPSIVHHNLYLLFSTYGDVLKIVSRPKNPKMRGQAHIVFSDDHSATLALKNLQGMSFFNKPIAIAYARNASKIIAAIEGTDDEVLPTYE